MSPSRRLAEETAIAVTTYHENSNVVDCYCPTCLFEFRFEDIDSTKFCEPPKFCPNCGRRNAAA